MHLRPAVPTAERTPFVAGVQDERAGAAEARATRPAPSSGGVPSEVARLWRSRDGKVALPCRLATHARPRGNPAADADDDRAYSASWEDSTAKADVTKG